MIMRWIFVLAALLMTVPGIAAQIYVFGDSHCFAFEKIKGCKPVHIGSITMNRIGRDGLSILDVRKYGVSEADILIFSFGEIDVRCHIKKQCEVYKRRLEEVIETLVDRYFETILQNCSFYSKILCLVYSVPPPTNAHFSEEYPFHGDLKERILISKILNAKLETLCAKHQILFLDVYDQYADSEGALNPMFSDGTVHISRDCHQLIGEKLFQLLAKIPQ